MSARLLVLGAGSGAADNVIRSLGTADACYEVVGAHADRFVLRRASTARRYLVPTSTHSDFIDALNRVIASERIDVVVPTSDADVRAVAEARTRLGCRAFLPALTTIDICQDKYAFAAFLAARGIAVPETIALRALDDLEAAFQRLAHHPRLWCRRRRGQGGLGALLVARPPQARAWIQYWSEMRDVAVSEFTLAEHLPGRDFAGQTLFLAGTPILTRVYERLSYLGGAAAPSGIGLATLSRRVADVRVAALAEAAVRALEPGASGIFTFDAREDAVGVPRLTEINAGRFSLSTNLLDLSDKLSMAEMYIRLALGERIEPIPESALVDDWYMVRDYDGAPAVLRGDDFFTGIDETP